MKKGVIKKVDGFARRPLIIPELGFSENIFGKFCDKSVWICHKSGYN